MFSFVNDYGELSGAAGSETINEISRLTQIINPSFLVPVNYIKNLHNWKPT